MKQNNLFYLLAFILSATCSCNSPEDIKQYAATEIYPQDSILQTLTVKKAMIVIAHDDDMCAMTGTISKLNKQGWEIAVLSFPLTPERNAAHQKACSKLLDAVTFYDLKPEQYRNDHDTNQVDYHAFPKAEFANVFNSAVVESELVKRVNEFGPSVIFSLDNDIGGYGHPEHVFISQLVVDLAAAKTINPTYIYQSVFTKHMETTIMSRHSERMKKWGFPGDEWENAKEIYDVNGMPLPSVQIPITSEANSKMEYLKSYNERERKTIGFFIPEFEKYSAEEYFTVFDREFFRIIKTN
jgi:LmbE family N-acetylglucosaminyl deacetylase